MRRKTVKKNESGWQKVQQDKKKQKVKELFIRFATLCLFLAVLGLAFTVWQNFKKAVWDGKHQLNLVIQADQIMVASLHPKDEILNILAIPPKTHIVAAKGYGEYPLANIFPLGEQEKINGGRLLSLSLQDFLGVPIDGFIKLPDRQDCRLAKEISEPKQMYPVYLCLLKGGGKTNLTIWDLIRIFAKTNKLRPGQIKTIFFTERGVKEKVLPDNSVILQPDYSRIDQLAVELYSDPEIFDEAITVSVANATPFPGLANKVGRLVKNLGAELISTNDAERNMDQSVIYYRNRAVKDNYTLKRLAKALQLKRLELNEKINEDLMIILGKDFSSLP